MRRDAEIEMLKEAAKQKMEDELEEKLHPLSKYSTTELKKELRRRKKLE
ncbi:MAG: hypothetical protein ACERKN_07235 [Velocimicrobium sp.]